MPSFATTIAATAFATLGLAAPVVRETSPATFYLNVTSIYTDGKYNNGQLSACHTSAGGECLCILPAGENNPQLFGLDSQTEPNGPANIFYELVVNGGANDVKQDLSFTRNITYPALEYGFFGGTGYVYNFTANENDVLSYQSGGIDINTFYICPEYVDYDHEGYPTLSLISDYQSIPSDSGCDAVSLTRSFPNSA